MFFHCNTSMKITDKNINLKKISIEWTGDIDKPIPKIIICTNCTNDKKILKSHQYKVSSKSLNYINSVFFKGNKTKFEIKINETNKKIYLPKLDEVILILMKNNENKLLIEDLKTFMTRIDY
jgi:hypothetical protein